MIKKTGSARWHGGLREGRGHVSTGSGALSDQPYGFATRFEEGSGTNPEELIGAAHASCFSMALSMVLGQSDLEAERIETSAEVSLEQQGEGFAVTASHLTVRATVPGATDEAFREAAEAAKDNCPISKLLDAKLSMDATLES